MMKPYESYKETNIPWVREIPEHWGFERIGSLFSERKTKVSDKDYSPLSVTKKGILPQLATAAKSDDGDNRKKVVIGDFVINSRSDRKGSSGISDLTGSVSLINIVLEPRQDNNSKFMHYLLKSNSFIEEYYRNGRGIVADLWTTRYSEMKTIMLPVPTRSEQDQIVRYLDWQLSKINKLIKAKKKQIELLNEQKQAIINKAVTKGLDDTVPMKDSGVDWLGEISTNVQIYKLKRLLKASLMYGANESGIDYSEGLSRYIRITDIDTIGNLKNYGMLSLPDDKSKNYNLEVGDILLARSGATVGKTFIYKSEYGRCCFAGYLIKASLRKEIILPEYFYLYTQSGLYQLWLKQIFIQATIQNVSAERYNYLQIPLWSLIEQKNIIAFVNNSSKNIVQAIDKIQHEINLLAEYKTSLISSVVTGKVDVRDIEIPDFEIDDDQQDIDKIEDTDDVEELEVE